MKRRPKHGNNGEGEEKKKNWILHDNTSSFPAYTFSPRLPEEDGKEHNCQNYGQE